MKSTSTFTQITLAVLLALGLAACGGGSESFAADGSAAAGVAVISGAPSPAGPRAHALALPAAAAHAAQAAAAATVEPVEAARQLMDFAEITFPGYFPPHAATLSAEPFSYRYYAETGTYLGVVTAANTPYVQNGIYVMGGVFGTAPVLVGQVADFITPVANYSLALSVERTPVQQGASSSVKATITRKNGFTGPVQLVVDGLPAGVTASAVTIAAGSTSADIQLTAQSSAPHSLPTVARVRAINGADTLNSALTVTVRGAPGVVDTSFGGGINITPIGYEDYANAAVVQPDGKVLVAGSATLATGTAIALVRHLRDGGLDPSFGTGGKLTTQVASSDQAYALALQPDGKIVVAGRSGQNGHEATGSDFIVLRYLPNGSLDPSFGNGGKVVTAFSGDTDFAQAVAIQDDGKIVVGGNTQSGANTSGIDFALARYLPNGALDPSFGNGGKVVTAMSQFNNSDQVYALALPVIDGEQRILAVGSGFTAARYKPDGSLDNSFGSGGKVSVRFGSGDANARAVALLPGGRMVLAGDFITDFAAAQLKVDGTLDTSFGTSGLFHLGVAANSNWDGATAVVRQADGKLVLGGWAYMVGSNSDFAALRLTASGSLDSSFGSGGVVTQATASGTKSDTGHALVLQADERVPAVRAIQAGEANASNNDFAVIRLWL